MATAESAVMELVRAIATSDAEKVRRMLEASPELASASVGFGATREEAPTYYLDEINHYVYLGDTALHIAAAAYELDLVRKLLTLGADVSAENRRGAQPLHYAVDGIPGSDAWRPVTQSAVIAMLIDAGADPNATDKSGVAPLHRAVRNRCGPAVRALLDGGADACRTNKSGSTPMKLATQTTEVAARRDVGQRTLDIALLFDARLSGFRRGDIFGVAHAGIADAGQIGR